MFLIIRNQSGLTHLTDKISKQKNNTYSKENTEKLTNITWYINLSKNLRTAIEFFIR